uniref:Endonuclease/exonuclease/phosphatase domain-containing protein n=1 Tax=Trichogramma kaykai TaxID=54128 RepID=A0ABD2W146_9HYME
MGDVWKTTTNRSSRNAQLTPASPKQCLTADSATEWGSRETKPRGRALLNALATLDVLLQNTGSEPTYVGEQGESVIDLTFASVSLYNRVGSCRISDVYTSSDHKAIVYEILLEENQGVGRAPLVEHTNSRQ